MKCPYCNEELLPVIKNENDWIYCCDNQNCKFHDDSNNQDGKHPLATSDFWQELTKTKQALDLAIDWLEQVATFAKCDDDLCREFTKRKLAEIKQITESPAENVQPDTKSRPVNVQK